ncbi:MAG: PLP-dependent aminotransferase family protein [Bacteroidales bacterium]|nr:PLP-dependent aminotransferase family protein [Bacteroidales bacterium]
MIDNLNDFLSKNMAAAKRSAIREILKFTQRPEVISFAGGLPAPASFPIEDIRTCMNEVLDEAGTKALQYGTTEGNLDLRNEIVKLYARNGIKITVDNLMITTASQQGLDIMARIFVNPGDCVICGLPSYLGGLSAFRAYGGVAVGIPFDEYGMRPELLDSTLAKLKAEGKKAKYIYLIPDFQNPAGITYPEFRRREILEIADKYDLFILEDSPYRDLRFDGKPQPTIYEMDTKGRVILLGTFSKTLAPGFRLGWVLAHPAVIEKFVTAKQGTDLCTPEILQLTAAKYMSKGLFEKNLKSTIDLYRTKRDFMLQCFDKYMPAGVKWTRPEGGLFLLLSLPEGYNTSDLFQVALKNNVAFVTGEVFHCDGSGKNTMRLNFSYASMEQIEEGVKRLATAIKDFIK